jgi:cytochrome c553
VYAASQLRNYRSAARATDPNSMMRTIAAKLTDEEIDAVASYLQGMR